MQVETPDLPSHRDPRAGLLEDADEVRELLSSVPAPVVAVGWSYGGDVIGVAAAGAHDVVRLVFVGAAPLPVTVQPRAVEFFDAEPVIHVDRSAATFLLDSEWWLYEEKGTTMPPDVQEHARINRRRPASIRINTDPVLAAAWTSIPTTVVLGRDDELVSADERRWIAENIDDVREVDDDHFVLFRHPDAIADVVWEALQGAAQRA